MDYIDELEQRVDAVGISRVAEMIIEECEGEGWTCKEVDGGRKILVSHTKHRRFEHLATIDVLAVEASAKKYASMFRRLCERVREQLAAEADAEAEEEKTPLQLAREEAAEAQREYERSGRSEDAREKMIEAQRKFDVMEDELAKRCLAEDHQRIHRQLVEIGEQIAALNIGHIEGYRVCLVPLHRAQYLGSMLEDQARWIYRTIHIGDCDRIWAQGVGKIYALVPVHLDDEMHPLHQEGCKNLRDMMARDCHPLDEEHVERKQALLDALRECHG